MSGNNVHAQLAQHSETLADKLASNNDLSNTILALLGRLIIICRARSRPLEGLDLSPLATQHQDGEFIISTHLKFNNLILRPPSLWKPSGDFEAFTASRAEGLALALSKNASLTAFFQKLAEKLDAYAQYKRIPFSRLRIQHPFISKDDVLVIGVGKDLA